MELTFNCSLQIFNRVEVRGLIFQQFLMAGLILSGLWVVAEHV